MIPRCGVPIDLSERELLIYKGWKDKLLLPEINEKLLAIESDPISVREYANRMKSYEQMQRLSNFNMFRR